MAAAISLLSTIVGLIFTIIPRYHAAACPASYRFVNGSVASLNSVAVSWPKFETLSDTARFSTMALASTYELVPVTTKVAMTPSGESANATAMGAGATNGPCEGAANFCTGDVTHWDGGEWMIPPVLWSCLRLTAT
jgi:hypothetical protein